MGPCAIHDSDTADQGAPLCNLLDFNLSGLNSLEAVERELSL